MLLSSKLRSTMDTWASWSGLTLSDWSGGSTHGGSLSEKLIDPVKLLLHSMGSYTGWTHPCYATLLDPRPWRAPSSWELSLDQLRI